MSATLSPTRTSEPRPRGSFPARVASACLAALVIASLLPGCVASPWIENFDGSAGPRTDAPVLVRRIEWDRMTAAEDARSARRSGTDLHPDDWPLDQRERDLAELARALQISNDPSTLRLLGRSAFRSTERRPESLLDGAARELGATLVVWSSAYVGKADVIRSEPLTEHRSGTWTDASDPARPGGTYSETTTVYVPVRVQGDEHAFVAYFLTHR